MLFIYWFRIQLEKGVALDVKQLEDRLKEFNSNPNNRAKLTHAPVAGALDEHYVCIETRTSCTWSSLINHFFGKSVTVLDRYSPSFFAPHPINLNWPIPTK